MKKLFCITLLIFLLVGTLAGCWLDVLDPEVEKGEFDFSVTYEINGETKTLSGQYVCEYNGMTFALDGGAHREWKEYIKDGELEIEEPIIIGTTKDGVEVTLGLDFYPEYFMDDPVRSREDAPVPYLSVTVTTDEGFYFLQEPEEVEEYCGAKIISYKYDEPIENSFI